MAKQTGFCHLGSALQSKPLSIQNRLPLSGRRLSVVEQPIALPVAGKTGGSATPFPADDRRQAVSNPRAWFTCPCMISCSRRKVLPAGAPSLLMLTPQAFVVANG